MTGMEAENEAVAQRLCRGVMRALDHLGWRSVPEFSLGSGRRVDVIGLDSRGHILIVEIKTSVADFRADLKWREYLDYCDEFLFAVPETFPIALIPAECGLMVADAFEAIIHRPPMIRPPLPPARRRQMLIDFGRLSADRLRRFTDPGI